MTVYEPGDRLATMSAKGEVRLFVVDADGALSGVDPLGHPETVHLDNGEVEALCDPAIEGRVVRVMGDVTCMACCHEAARIYSTEQAGSPRER